MWQKGYSCLIALGSNQEWRQHNSSDIISESIMLISKSIGMVQRVARFYSSESFPKGSGPDFVNTCILIRTSLSPEDILNALHDIEKRFDRVRQQRWAPRTVDLDLIFYGQKVFPDEATYDAWRSLSPDRQREIAPDGLILPHPRLQDRSFVLGPLLDIMPEWHHPVLGSNVLQMWQALADEDRNSIWPI